MAKPLLFPRQVVWIVVVPLVFFGALFLIPNDVDAACTYESAPFNTDFTVTLGTDCISQNRTGGTYYARYITVTIPPASGMMSVIASGNDPYLFMMEGKSMNPASVWIENNNCTSNSWEQCQAGQDANDAAITNIFTSPDPGSYGYIATYELTTANPGVTGAFTFKVIAGASYTLSSSPSPNTSAGNTSGGGLNCGYGGATCTVTRTGFITMNASAAPGYQFKFWQTSGSASTYNGSAASMITFDLTSNTSVNPVYNPILTLTKAGANATNGSVTSSGGGITCTTGSATCGDGVADYSSGSSITLTANPGTGTVSWSGCDSSSGNTCTLSMNGPENVTATFTASASTYVLGTTLVGSGQGSVSGNSISCSWNGSAQSGTCQNASVTSGTAVVLTRTVTSGSFGGWAGVTCTEGNQTSATCSFTMTGNTTVSATFTAAASTNTLTVTAPANGTIISNDGFITCGDMGASCSYNYSTSASVTLTAIPTGSNTFTGWGGGTCSGTASTCTFTMSAARTVSATFTAAASTYLLSPTVSGGGAGSVTGGGLSCSWNGSTTSGACTNGSITAGTYTLTRTVTSGSFGGWGGITCSEGTQTGTNCTFTLTGNTFPTVVFTAPATTYVLNTTLTGSGQGSVSGNSISCSWNGSAQSGTCQNASVTSGTAVVLTRTVTSGSFGGWAGVTCTEGNQTSATCSFTMTGNTTVTASFNSCGGGTSFSDLFGSSTLDCAWTWTQGATGAAYSLTNSPGALQISTQASSASVCYGSTVACSRVMRSITPSAATMYEIKINGTAISGQAQAYGILLYQSAGNYIRFESWTNGAAPTLMAFPFIGGVQQSGITGPASPAAFPWYMRVLQNGTSYTFFSSADGSTWNTAGTFTLSGFAAVQAGVAVNTGGASSPATTLSVDYMTAGPAYALTVSKSGTGASVSSVTSSSGGITCAVGSATCADGSEFYPANQSINLTAAPGSGYSTAWTGCDSNPTANSCTVSMGAAKNVSVSFTDTQYTLGVYANTGAGTGTITGGGLNCAAGTGGSGTSGTCSLSVSGSVTLTAAPSGSSAFSSWSGGPCSGSLSATCSFTMSADTFVRATFDPVYQLTVTKSGTGTGSVTSAPSGITSCTSSCSANFSAGSSVSLTATPGSGYLTAWSGCTTATGNSCTVSMTSARTVTVSFVADSPVAHYKFNEATGTTATDSSGNNNTATLTNGPTRMSGRNGGAVWFDGADDRIVAPYSTSLDVSGSQLTLSMWVNPELNSATTDTVILGKAFNTASMAFPYYQYGLEMTGGTRPTLYLGGYNGSYIGTSAQMSTTLAYGTWAYITVTYDGTEVRFYKDGVFVNSVPVAISMYPRLTELRLGSDALGSQDYKGLMDDVRIYGRALSAADVTNLYNSVSASYTLGMYANTGSGTGSVTSTPAGMNCQTGTGGAGSSGTCSINVYADNSVTLTAVLGANSTFTGWSGGGCSGTAVTCTVSMTTATFVRANFDANRTLTLTKTGNGTGQVNGGPISCGTTCTTATANQVDGSVVTLTATPSANTDFAGWSGACTGTALTCTVTLDADKSVAANFALKTFALTITKAGAGAAASNPSSNPAGITCGASSCTGLFVSDSSVALSANPAPGYQVSWTGCSTSSGTSCTVVMSAAKTVTVTYGLSSYYTLTVTRGGDGQGTVTGTHATLGQVVNCGNDCSQSFTSSQSLTLTAAPASGSSFTGWTGPCSGTGTCTITVDQAYTVGATFGSNQFELVVLKLGNGAGGSTITSNPSGISCDDTCLRDDGSYNRGSVVTLTATPVDSTIAVSWSGCDTATGNTCTVTMDAVKSVLVTFETPVALSGYIWSSNIGWISLNCSNRIGANPAACTTSGYKVFMDAAGNLSGYGWSPNVGWVSFNPTDLQGVTSPKVDLNTGNVSGFARAVSACQTNIMTPAVSCTSAGAGTVTGGWTGYTLLSSGISTGYHPSPTISGLGGVTYKRGETINGLQTNSFVGYAWGDKILGWLDWAGNVLCSGCGSYGNLLIRKMDIYGRDLDGGVVPARAYSAIDLYSFTSIPLHEMSNLVVGNNNHVAKVVEIPGYKKPEWASCTEAGNAATACDEFRMTFPYSPTFTATEYTYTIGSNTYPGTVHLLAADVSKGLRTRVIFRFTPTVILRARPATANDSIAFANNNGVSSGVKINEVVELELERTFETCEITSIPPGAIQVSDYDTLTASPQKDYTSMRFEAPTTAGSPSGTTAGYLFTATCNDNGVGNPGYQASSSVWVPSLTSGGPLSLTCGFRPPNSPVAPAVGRPVSLEVNITGGTPNYTVTWSGTEFNPSSPVTSVGPETIVPITKIYSTIGPKTVTVNVADSAGATATCTMTAPASGPDVKIVPDFIKEF